MQRIEKITLKGGRPGVGRCLNFTQNEIEDICLQYQNGVSRTKLKKKYNCSDSAILRILKNAGLHIRSIKETNISHYDLNLDFFRNQSSDLAYFLGFMAADGGVHKKENFIYLELQTSDKEILERINFTIGNSRPVKDYISQRGYKNSKLYFYNKEVKEILKDYHIVPNKTYDSSFGFPDKIEKKYLPDYLRGFTDGDGSFKQTGNSPTWQIDSASKKFIEDWKEYLDEIGIFCSISVNQKTNVKLYRLYCYGYEKVGKIYNLLYSYNPNLFLIRKKEKAEKLLKNKIPRDCLSSDEDKKIC